MGEAVTERSARLAGAGIAAIIRRIPRETVTVAIDGSLLRYHPTYKKRLEESIDTMLKQRPSTLVARQSFTLKLITDGAVVGAGIAAACFHRDANGNNASDQGQGLSKMASKWPSSKNNQICRYDNSSTSIKHYKHFNFPCWWDLSNQNKIVT